MKAKLRRPKDSLYSPHTFLQNPFLIISIIVLADQITKILALKYLPFICNSGVAFGLKGGGIFFSIAMIVLVIFMMKDERVKLKLLALSFIFAGGFSNFIDRIFFGCVRDFINIVNFFPVFNLADAAITLGVVSVILLSVKKRHAKS